MASPRVSVLTATELKALMDAGKAPALIDVRTPDEFEIASVEGARLLDREGFDELLQAPKDTPLVFMCHHGVRSHSAAAHFVAQGFTAVSNLAGGIDAWSLDVDPDVPRY